MITLTTIYILVIILKAGITNQPIRKQNFIPERIMKYMPRPLVKVYSAI